MLKGGTAVETHARDARHDEIDGQYVSRFTAGIVGGGAVHLFYAAVRECCGVETGGSLGIMVVPKTDGVLRYILGHCDTPLRRGFLSVPRF